MTIQAMPLSVALYQAYGNVIQAGTHQEGTAAHAKSANQGTAKRYDFLATLENRRADGGNGAGAGAALETAPGTLAKSAVSVAIARPNLCVFSCTPQVTADHPNFEIKLLERHPFSTQVFIPMGGPKRYLVIVCLSAAEPNGEPDLTTLRAFVAHGNQGITYHPGVWHHPMVAMDVPTDFACWVAEDGTVGDTQVVPVVPAIAVVPAITGT